jgi:hypothetical protein
VDTCGDYPLFFGGGANAGWPDASGVLPQPSPIASGTVASPRPSGMSTNTPAACVGFIVGDGNKDKKLDLTDSSYLLSKIGKNINDCADMNNDRIINVIDLAIMRKLFIEKNIIRVRVN